MHSGSSDEDEDHKQFKIAIVGNGAVGKTSIIRRLCQSGFKTHYNQTLGLDFYTKQLPIPNSNVVASLQVWDVGGQQLGGKMIEHYLSNSDAILCVYDVTNPSSLQDVEDWKDCIVKVFQGKAEKPKLILVGNKTDLPYQKVTKETHDEVAATYGMDAYLVSAISGERIQSMFIKIAADLAEVSVDLEDVDWGDRVAVTVDKRIAPRSRLPILHATECANNNNACAIM